MKKIFRNVLATVAIASVASCAEKPFNEVETVPNGSQIGSNNLTQMSFTASMEEDVVSKTTFAPATGDVLWEASDVITVFSGTAEGQEFTPTNVAEDGSWASFSGLADASAETYYAVYPHSANNTYADGTLAVSIPSQQTAVADGFASGANVAVAISSDESVKFRNVTSLLGIKFDEADCAYNTKSITVKAKKDDSEYWGLAGQAQIGFDSETNLPIVGEGDVQAVILNAPAEGFQLDVVYYIPVYAVGDCAGFEVTFTDVDDAAYTTTNSTAGTLERSRMLDFGVIPSPYPAIELTGDIEFVLDFQKSNWPFYNALVAADAQTTSRETYYYGYAYDTSINKRKYLPFTIGGSSEGNNYESTSTGLYFIPGGGRIYLPEINDMYLRVIKITKPAAGRIDFLGCGLIGWSQTNYSYELYSDKVIWVKTDGTKDSKNIPSKPYYLRNLDPDRYLKTLTLTYSSTAPGVAPAI